MDVSTEPTATLRIERDGVGLNVLDWGGNSQGRPLLLVHGLAGNAWHWSTLAPLLANSRVGEDHHLLAIDQRGHGDSDKPRSRYEIDEFAQDLLALQDHLDRGPVTLVGHSRGGWLSAYIAGRWPQRVERTVLVDPARIVHASPESAARFYANIRARLGPFPSAEAAIEAAKQSSPRSDWTDAHIASHLRGFTRRDDGTLEAKVPAWVLDELREVRLAADIVSPELGNASVPTLLVIATRESETDQAERMEYARLMPDVRVELLDASHQIAHDRPVELAHLIDQFLSE